MILLIYSTVSLRTDKEGYFKLNHIKCGNYKIYASSSKERAFTVNPKTDAYGFLKYTLHLTAPIKNITISLVKVDVNDFKIQSKLKATTLKLNLLNQSLPTPLLCCINQADFKKCLGYIVI